MNINPSRRTEQENDTSKLESVGRLAGGIAHEFNNLLTVITGYSCVLLETHGPGDPDHEALTQIHAAAGRAAVLVRQLLAVAGQQMLRPVVIDVNELVRGLSHVFQRVLGPNVHLELNLEPSLPPIHADPGCIGQVLLDLAANARDAMPAGGRMTLTSSAESEGGGSGTDAPSGPAVRLTISDSGHGMDEATLARLFEPFFTTKEIGRGTGLSLAAAYGIVKQCGGRLEVASQLGQGTTFTLTLPAAPPEAP
jgi:two-component system cell cycle sensor histidine kinase/response regulator CckA